MVVKQQEQEVLSLVWWESLYRQKEGWEQHEDHLILHFQGTPIASQPPCHCMPKLDAIKAEQCRTLKNLTSVWMQRYQIYPRYRVPQFGRHILINHSKFEPFSQITNEDIKLSQTWTWLSWCYGLSPYLWQQLCILYWFAIISLKWKSAYRAWGILLQHLKFLLFIFIYFMVSHILL